MKKFLIFLFTTFLLITSVSFALDTENWYVYNNQNTEHSFTISFPNTWKSSSTSSIEYGFLPQNEYGKDAAIQVQEFENKTLQKVIESFALSDEVQVIETDYELIQSKKEDLIIKKVQYSEFEVVFIKRGNKIISIKHDIGTYDETFEAIYSSLTFTDSWHQYIDFKENYTFIFPQEFDLNIENNAVSIKNKNSNIFKIQIYTSEGEEYQNGEDTDFHGYKAKIVTIEEKESLVVEHEDKKYLLTFSDNNKLAEILESLEFFTLKEIEDDYTSFINFPDVRNDHPNATAINKLVKDNVIDGYPDGTFQPDGTITRAELTKMVVAIKTQANKTKYKNCFEDVGEEWFAKYVCYAKNIKWVQGYPDGNFHPESEISRVEAIKIILEALVNDDYENYEIAEEDQKQIPEDIDQEAWYLKYFKYSYDKDLLDLQHFEDDQYKPNEAITRKEVAEILYRISLM